MGLSPGISADEYYMTTALEIPTTREDIQLAARDVIPIGDVVLEVLRNHFLGRVCKPIRELQAMNQYQH